MKTDKTKQIYLDDPTLHLRKLSEFKDRLSVRILGEENAETRGEFEFCLDRTKDKIREIQRKLLP